MDCVGLGLAMHREGRVKSHQGLMGEQLLSPYMWERNMWIKLPRLLMVWPRPHPVCSSRMAAGKTPRPGQRE